MPTLKKLIKQMEQNKPYIMEINQYIQQEEQNLTHSWFEKDIPFENNVNEYKLTAKTILAYRSLTLPRLQIYNHKK